MEHPPRQSPEVQGPEGASWPRAAVHFLCARRYLTLPDTRPTGTIARCPTCGRAMTLPPRQDGDPTVRRFDLSC